MPRGKTLHLGPRQTGQIADEHLEHKPLKRLIDDGKIELQDAAAGAGKGVQHDRGRSPHESTQGHQARGTAQVKGDR